MRYILAWLLGVPGIVIIAGISSLTRKNPKAALRENVRRSS